MPAPLPAGQLQYNTDGAKCSRRPEVVGRNGAARRAQGHAPLSRSCGSAACSAPGRGRGAARAPSATSVALGRAEQMPHVD